MSDYLPGKLIRFYICSNCAITKHDVATDLSLRQSKAVHVRPWDCSQCGRHVHRLEEQCFTVAIHRLTVREYDRNAKRMYEIWFVDKNYGYFDSSITAIADIET